ncbi:MAG: hypothetical protein GY910_13005 [bacterium]|nr:hypothetical protein [bacterium]
MPFELRVAAQGAALRIGELRAGRRVRGIIPATIPVTLHGQIDSMTG